MKGDPKTRRLTISALTLGMHVNLLPGDPYGWCTVIAVHPTAVVLFRPYTHVSDSPYGWHLSAADGIGEQVIAYTGAERVTLLTTDDRTVEVSTETAAGMLESVNLKGWAPR